MLTLLFLVSMMETPQSTWSQLIQARIQRNSTILDPVFWTPEMQTGLALQEYLMTLGQNGYPDSAPVIETFFTNPVLQGTALFAYGELTGASPEPLFLLKGKVREENQILLAEALSKLSGATHGERIAAFWNELPATAKNGSLFYFWRNNPDGLTQKVLQALEAMPAHGGNTGYLYYLYRSRSLVPEGLLTRLLKNYQSYPQTLIYVTRIQPDKVGAELKAQWAGLCEFYDWRIRVNALNAIIGSGDQVLIEKQGLALLGDPNPNVVRTAIGALVGLNKPEVDRKLVYNPVTFSSSQVQTLILGAGKERSADFFRLAKNWDKSENPWQRVQWIRFLAETGDPAHEKLLGKMLNGWRWEQGTPGEKVQAFRSLAARSPEGMAQFVKEALETADPYLMSEALDVLAAQVQAGRANPHLNLLKNLAAKFYIAPDFHSAFIRTGKLFYSQAEYDQEVAKLRKHPDFLVRNLALEATPNPTPEIRRGIYERGWLHRLDPDIHHLASKMISGGEVWNWVLDTDKGKVVIKLQGDYAPITCSSMVHLANRNYFDKMAIHRVVPNFVVQAGDNRGDGNGGPGYTIPCEVNTLRHRRGSVGMALSGKDTGGSQFFINHSDQPHLDGGYTVFGHVVEGMNVVDRLEEGDLILSSIAVRVEGEGSGE